MLQQLERFDIDLVYRPRAQVYLADTLSIAANSFYTCKKQGQLEKKLDLVCSIDDTESLQNSTLKEIADANSSDTVLQAVKAFLQQGWPHE